MKNVILVTHGDFAKGILTSMELVLGRIENVDFVSISAQERIPEIAAAIEAKINAFCNEESTVILSDIAGGSTTRAAMELLGKKEKIYLITGLNLGLLLEVALLSLNGDEQSDRQVLRDVVERSKSTIYLVNDIMDREDICIMSDSAEL